MESIMTIDFKKIREEVQQGFNCEQKHASADLFIYNYTVKAQYDWHWTTETKKTLLPFLQSFIIPPHHISSGQFNYKVTIPVRLLQICFCRLQEVFFKILKLSIKINRT